MPAWERPITIPSMEFRYVNKIYNLLSNNIFPIKYLQEIRILEKKKKKYTHNHTLLYNSKLLLIYNS